jgi:hypothetical protein
MDSFDDSTTIVQGRRELYVRQIYAWTWPFLKLRSTWKKSMVLYDMTARHHAHRVNVMDAIQSVDIRVVLSLP